MVVHIQGSWWIFWISRTESVVTMDSGLLVRLKAPVAQRSLSMAWWVPWRTNCPRGLRASGIVGVMWGSVHFGQIASRPLRSTAHYLKETVMINHHILRVSYLHTNPIFVKTSHFVQIVHAWITENWVGYGTFWQIWQPSDLETSWNLRKKEYWEQR